MGSESSDPVSAKGKTMTFDEYDNLPQWVATVTRDGETFEWGRFAQWNEETARELVAKLFPTATAITIRPWKPEPPKGQMSLYLVGGEGQVSTVRQKLRAAVSKAKAAFSPWTQLRLKLYVKTIFKARTGFWWTRPDGRQFYCKTVRNLIARIMDYDGHLLQSTLRKVKA
jgi:hypothetical protein